MAIFDFGMIYPKEQKVYKFLLFNDDKEYEWIQRGDFVIVYVNEGKKEIKTKISYIRHFSVYNRYYCREVKRK